MEVGGEVRGRVKPCEVCGKQITVRNMATHVDTVHRVWDPRGGPRPRRGPTGRDWIDWIVLLSLLDDLSRRTLFPLLLFLFFLLFALRFTEDFWFRNNVNFSVCCFNMVSCCILWCCKLLRIFFCSAFIFS